MKQTLNRVVAFTMVLMGVSLPIFLATGYTALYFAWPLADMKSALPYLPWARNSGMVAMVGAAVALGILFSSRTFPLPAKTRFWLSLMATITIGLFAEFRNEGKFFFKNHGHFFGPGTWIRDALDRVVSSSGEILYRIEYSHWNDFLMGPAIVSVLFSLVFVKIYGTFRKQGSIMKDASTTNPDLDHTLRFARILMNVGLFWFFIQAWAEKAGYFRNPHSNDEIDLPVEFAGTIVGFWMARVLTRPIDGRYEKFRSTLLFDFLCSGVIGLLYTLIVGPLADSVTSAVGHALYPAVADSLEFFEYTPLQRHMRPIELLLLAGATWWGLNWFYKSESLTQLNPTFSSSEAEPRESESGSPDGKRRKN